MQKDEVESIRSKIGRWGKSSQNIAREYIPQKAQIIEKSSHAEIEDITAQLLALRSQKEPLARGQVLEHYPPLPEVISLQETSKPAHPQDFPKEHVAFQSSFKEIYSFTVSGTGLQHFIEVYDEYQRLKNSYLIENGELGNIRRQIQAWLGEDH